MSVPRRARAYDFTADVDRAIRRLCTLETFTHIRPDALLSAVAQCRSRSTYGTYASVTALRFRDGATETRKGRWKWVWPVVRVGGVVRLYLVTFYLPRFLDLSLDERLATIVHELFHISPRCDGDLRRFKGRNYAHGHSRKAYDEALKPVCQEARDTFGLDAFPLFVNTFEEIRQSHGGVTGRTVRALKPVRMPVVPDDEFPFEQSLPR